MEWQAVPLLPIHRTKEEIHLTVGVLPNLAELMGSKRDRRIPMLGNNVKSKLQ